MKFKMNVTLEKGGSKMSNGFLEELYPRDSLIDINFVAYGENGLLCNGTPRGSVVRTEKSTPTGTLLSECTVSILAVTLTC